MTYGRAGTPVLHRSRKGRRAGCELNLGCFALASSDLFGKLADSVSGDGGDDGAGDGEQQRAGVAADPSRAGGCSLGHGAGCALPAEGDIVAAGGHEKKAPAGGGELTPPRGL